MTTAKTTTKRTKAESTEQLFEKLFNQKITLVVDGLLSRIRQLENGVYKVAVPAGPKPADVIRVWDCCGMIGNHFPWATWKGANPNQRGLLPVQDACNPYLYIYSEKRAAGTYACGVKDKGLPFNCIGGLNIDPIREKYYDAGMAWYRDQVWNALRKEITEAWNSYSDPSIVSEFNSRGKETNGKN